MVECRRKPRTRKNTRRGGAGGGKLFAAWMEVGRAREAPGASMPSPASAPRKVMVVVEPTREAAGALQYALSHGVVERDELILLYVDNPGSWRNAISTFFRRSPGTIVLPAHTGGAGNASGGASLSVAGGDSGLADFLEVTRRVCEAAQPTVRVRTERVEIEAGKEKATVILSQSKLHGVDTLIIGQRRSLSSALLRSKRPGISPRGPRLTDTAEYLIEKCSCTCVGVHRKGQNAGYLLNTKTFRNFWLLA